MKKEILIVGAFCIVIASALIAIYLFQTIPQGGMELEILRKLHIQKFFRLFGGMCFGGLAAYWILIAGIRDIRKGS